MDHCRDLSCLHLIPLKILPIWRVNKNLSKMQKCVTDFLPIPINSVSKRKPTYPTLTKPRPISLEFHSTSISQQYHLNLFDNMNIFQAEIVNFHTKKKLKYLKTYLCNRFISCKLINIADVHLDGIN